MQEFEPFLTLEGFAHQALWQSGKPIWAALLVLKEYLRQNNPCRIEIDIPSGVFLQNASMISIGEGSVIEPSVLIQGPCIIGKHCVIRHGAYIRGDVVMGDYCHIGHSTEVKGSILLNHAAATHFVYLGDSILGNRTNLGAGVKCANLRLDREEVSIVIEGKRVLTGLRKFGAVVGDHVQIGCNSVLNPGTLIGRNSFSYAMMNIGGYV
ncbi:MAG: UDP-N-acetylglucosamine diphosphorylase, partial [Chlamydiae bacterium RIFCSPHIGHO2_02_FULL_45_9]